MCEVLIYEVGARDGLQNETVPMSTQEKIKLINMLSETGLKKVESGAFVSPKWVPAMADSREVMDSIYRKDGVNYPVLAMNMKGLEGAISVNADTVCIGSSPSEMFCLKNTNCTVEESLNRAEDITRLALDKGMKVRGYVSCVIYCPYEKEMDPLLVAKMCEKLKKMGCYEVSLGDTLGIGTPNKTKKMFSSCIEAIGIENLAVHFHDTYGQALANILACLDMGVKVIDTSIGGLGGCPYAPGARGNVATEDVLFMLNGMGIKTGIDIDKICATSEFAFSQFGKKPLSRVYQALEAKRQNTT